MQSKHPIETVYNTIDELKAKIDKAIHDKNQLEAAGRSQQKIEKTTTRINNLQEYVKALKNISFHYQQAQIARQFTGKQAEQNIKEHYSSINNEINNILNDLKERASSLHNDLVPDPTSSKIDSITQMKNNFIKLQETFNADQQTNTQPARQTILDQFNKIISEQKTLKNNQNLAVNLSKAKEHFIKASRYFAAHINSSAEQEYHVEEIKNLLQPFSASNEDDIGKLLSTVDAYIKQPEQVKLTHQGLIDDLKDRQQQLSQKLYELENKINSLNKEIEKKQQTKQDLTADRKRQQEITKEKNNLTQQSQGINKLIQALTEQKDALDNKQQKPNQERLQTIAQKNQEIKQQLANLNEVSSNRYDDIAARYRFFNHHDQDSGKADDENQPENVLAQKIILLQDIKALIRQAALHEYVINPNRNTAETIAHYTPYQRPLLPYEGRSRIFDEERLKAFSTDNTLDELKNYYKDLDKAHHELREKARDQTDYIDIDPKSGQIRDIKKKYNPFSKEPIVSEKLLARLITASVANPDLLSDEIKKIIREKRPSAKNIWARTKNRLAALFQGLNNYHISYNLIELVIRFLFIFGSISFFDIIKMASNKKIYDLHDLLDRLSNAGINIKNNPDRLLDAYDLVKDMPAFDNWLHLLSTEHTQQLIGELQQRIKMYEERISKLGNSPRELQEKEKLETQIQFDENKLTKLEHKYFTNQQKKNADIDIKNNLEHLLEVYDLVKNVPAFKHWLDSLSTEHNQQLKLALQQRIKMYEQRINKLGNSDKDKTEKTELNELVHQTKLNLAELERSLTNQQSNKDEEKHSSSSKCFPLPKWITEKISGEKNKGKEESPINLEKEQKKENESSAIHYQSKL